MRRQNGCRRRVYQVSSLQQQSVVLVLKLFLEKVAQGCAGAGAGSLVLINRCRQLIIILGADGQGQVAALAVQGNELGFNLVAFRQNPGSKSEEHTSELPSRGHLVCRPLLEKKHNDPL